MLMGLFKSVDDMKDGGVVWFERDVKMEKGGGGSDELMKSPCYDEVLLIIMNQHTTSSTGTSYNNIMLGRG